MGAGCLHSTFLQAALLWSRCLSLFPRSSLRTMSSYNNKKLEDGILVQHTFTVVSERRVDVSSGSPPPSSTPISLRRFLDFCLATAKPILRVVSCGTADMDEGDEKLPLLGQKD
ncbi:hypothetical protein EDB80DRAFT_733138 [Ilyonectria destructans]|nr:hypothetical protein EDB80DRAFT_733138 [Ilyonectria destructans]